MPRGISATRDVLTESGSIMSPGGMSLSHLVNSPRLPRKSPKASVFCPTPSTQHNATVATSSVRGTLSPGHDSSTRSGVWRDGVGSRLGKLAERLVASESLAEKLTGQVMELRSQMLVSAGSLKRDEGALLLDHIESILRHQRQLQDSTQQLSFENAQLRAQLTEKPGGSPSPALQNLIKVASPARSSSAVSPEDVMEEFAKLGEECKVLNVQVAEKNKKLEKMSSVLASMERALVESERERLLAEHQIQDLTGQLIAANKRNTTKHTEGMNISVQSSGMGSLDSHLCADLNSSSKKNRFQDETQQKRTEHEEEMYACRRQRDAVCAQLHTALSLLERQSRLTGAITNLSTSDAKLASASDAARPYSVATANLERDVEAELQALRLGSLVASDCRAETQQLREKLSRAQQALDLALSESAELRLLADDKGRRSQSLQLEKAEQAKADLARELTDSNYKERALVETSRTMERRIRDLEQEVSTLRQHRASDQSAVASWETRALLAEDKLKSSDARFAQATSQLQLVHEQKESLLRHHEHLKNMAKVYAPSSLAKIETDHYSLESVLVKNKTHIFLENNTPETSWSSIHSPSWLGEDGKKRAGERSTSPVKRPASTKSSRLREERATGGGGGGIQGKKEWAVVGPYTSPKPRVPVKKDAPE